MMLVETAGTRKDHCYLFTIYAVRPGYSIKASVDNPGYELYQGNDSRSSSPAEIFQTILMKRNHHEAFLFSKAENQSCLILINELDKNVKMPYGRKI